MLKVRHRAARVTYVVDIGNKPGGGFKSTRGEFGGMMSNRRKKKRHCKAVGLCFDAVKPNNNFHVIFNKLTTKMEISVADVYMKKYNVQWRSRSYRVNEFDNEDLREYTKTSATFYNDYGATCRVLSKFGKTKLYHVTNQSLNNVPDVDVPENIQCKMKYNTKTGKIIVFREGTVITFDANCKSRNPFLTEINVNHRTIIFTEPDLHFNRNMKYESTLGSKFLSKHYIINNTATLEINTVLLDSFSNQDSQITREELENLIFLMCVVTKEGRRISFLAGFMIFILIIAFIGIMWLVIRYWILK